MTLPNDFNEWENLQDLVRKDHNRAVSEYFKNQPDNDISTPKSRLKHTCRIKDADTATMTLMRMWLFEITIGHAQSLQTPISGIPTQELQRITKYKPQVKLYFQEEFDSQVHTERKRLATAEITFRLMDKESDTIDRRFVEKLAADIKKYIAKPPLVWAKGWYKCTYTDISSGYDFRLMVKSENEGIRVIKQVLSIRDEVYQEKFLQFIDHKRTYSNNPGTHRVYGRNVTKPIERPRVDVKFRHAQLLIYGQPNPINLVAIAPGRRLRGVIELV